MKKVSKQKTEKKSLKTELYWAGRNWNVVGNVLGILLSSHTSLPILKAPSLISLSSHFSLTFLFHFHFSIPLFYLPLQLPFMVYLVLHPVHPHFISHTLFSLFLSISRIQTAYGNEFSLWQWAVYPLEQQQSLVRGRQISFLRSYYNPCLWLWHSGARFFRLCTWIII